MRLNGDKENSATLSLLNYWLETSYGIRRINAQASAA